MTSPHWDGAEAAARARGAAEESGRLARSYGDGCLMSTALAQVVATVLAAVAAPIVVQVLNRVGLRRSATTDHRSL
ncbi:hypothetical protein [Nocardia sp. bgisy134]|uniref:hypothetical protein n=1 Tax=unclassified Nocardia TaxID=2637762 RepID=UPI003D7257D6